MTAELKPLTPKTLEYVQTKNGMLRGFKQRNIYNFLGVKYGEVQRWHEAKPVKPWKGVRNALNFGNVNFPTRPFTPWDSCGVAHELYSYSEDCLNLNLWSPTIDSNAKKPVVVWFHGGGFSSGFATEMQAYDGENLARFGDVVVVTVNHRLNLFGFLDVSQFGEAYANSGNIGISDLVMSLRWVHENIAAFGGDPDNVTICGQSGGGQKVTCLLQTPAAAGLFHKAVVQSGVSPYHQGKEPVIVETVDKSRAVIDLLFKKLNTDKLETLEELTPEELLKAYHAISPELEEMGYNAGNWTAIAGDYYKGDPYVVGFSDCAKKIPVMVGCTFAEMPQMRVFNKHEKTEEEQLAILRECFPGQDVTAVVELFKKAWPNRCLTDIIEMSGRMEVRASVLRYSDLRAATCEAPTYTYIFAHDFPQEGGRGAWHCAELPMMFHNACIYPENYNAGVLDGYEDAVCSCWVNMAKYGNPSNPLLGVEWPAYKVGECATLIMDDTFEVKNDFDRALIQMRRGMKLEVTEKYTQFTQTVN